MTILLFALLALAVGIICFQQAVIIDRRKAFTTLLDDAVAVTKGYWKATGKLNSRRQHLLEKAYRSQLKRAYKRDPNMRNFAEREAASRTLSTLTIPYLIANKASAKQRMKQLRSTVQRANMFCRLPG